MQYCKRCVMPSTRPGITFNEEGICQACINHDKKKDVNWDARFEELKELCDKYRGMNGDGYDCMIAVSGGKDSHYQVYVMKELLGMNPLLVSAADNFTMTEAGKHNIRNISEEFGCDIITFNPNIKLQKKLMKKTFEKFGKPTFYVDRLIYTYPLQMAIKFNTPLLVYGENITFEYSGGEETYSAREQINNGVASGIDFKELLGDGVTEKELSMLHAPTQEELSKLDPIYLSYFIEWNSFKNYEFSKSRGFKDLTHEWDRTNCVENFDQVDSIAYWMHPWMKYPKFGHAAATDYTSRMIRYGMINREEALKLVDKHDHALDPLIVEDFCSFLGYSRREFWSIVDGYYNKKLFEKNNLGQWALKEGIIKLRNNK